MIGVGFCDGIGSVLSVSTPHCVSLRYVAACCALCSRCMCIPSLSLLWYGVGVYFLFRSLIPNHLSLVSRSLEIDSSILHFLSSLLVLINSLFSCGNSWGFLSFAACSLFSSIPLDFSESSNRLFLSLGFIWGIVSIPCFSQCFMHYDGGL